jgi:norsolorinic acid ketoreductase
MVEYLKSNHGIEVLDIVVANAGLLKQWGPVRSVESRDLTEHFIVNTLAPIQLYQATTPLLDKAAQPGKFAVVSTTLASNGLMDQFAPLQMIAYNMSKAALNSAMGRVHREEDKLIVFPIHPGWIATNMGSQAAIWAGMGRDDPPDDLNESCAGMMKVIDAATKEDGSGKFYDFKGGILPW